MKDLRDRPARDHPPGASLDSKDAEPEIEVTLEEFNPEDYIEAILAGIDKGRDPPSVEALARESQPPRTGILLPPPTARSLEWVLDDETRRSSVPAVVPTKLVTDDDEERFSFPPPVTPSMMPVTSVSPMAMGDDEDEVPPRKTHRPKRRRAERVVIGAFAAVGAAVVTFAAYDIAKTARPEALWATKTAARGVAALTHAEIATPTIPTHEMATVEIRAAPPPHSRMLTAKDRLGGEPMAEEGGIPFDATATSIALDIAAAEAMSKCAVGARDPVSVSVRVTFDPSGRVSSAVAGESPESTAIMRVCTESTFLKTRVPRFTGEPKTFTRWLRIK